MVTNTSRSLVLPERFKKSLWAIIRSDSTRRTQAFYVYDDHSTNPPTTCLCLWRTMEGAERYNYGELKGTGKLHPITQDRVMGELRGFKEAGVKWVIFDRIPVADTASETARTGWAKIETLMAYLSGGGRIGS